MCPYLRYGGGGWLVRAAVENGEERKHEKQVVPRHRMPRGTGVESWSRLFKTQTTWIYLYDIIRTESANLIIKEQSLLGPIGTSEMWKNETSHDNDYDDESKRYITIW